MSAPPKPKKPPRVVLTLRVRPAAVASLDRIAAERGVTRSEVHRAAITEYANRHDPARRNR